MTETEYRRRLERELHDGPQQDLVALIVNLQLARMLLDADPAAARALLEEIRADAQAALDETRLLALRIYPPTLDDAGLRAALRAAAPEASIDVDLGPDCPEEIAACAYFCCSELLPAAAVSVRREGGVVVFEVAAPNAAPDLSRVEALGGRLTVEPGRVSGVLPLF